MQIEKIFRKIPIFRDIKIDKILFESSYPILLHVLKIEIFIYLYAVLTIRMKQNGLEQKHRILI